MIAAADVLLTEWQSHIRRDLDLCCERLSPDDYRALLEAVLADVQTRLMGTDSPSVDERGST